MIIPHLTYSMQVIISHRSSFEIGKYPKKIKIIKSSIQLMKPNSVLLENGQELPCDSLILATGAYFHVLLKNLHKIQSRNVRIIGVINSSNLSIYCTMQLFKRLQSDMSVFALRLWNHHQRREIFLSTV